MSCRAAITVSNASDTILEAQFSGPVSPPALSTFHDTVIGRILELRLCTAASGSLLEEGYAE